MRELVERVHEVRDARQPRDVHDEITPCPVHERLGSPVFSPFVQLQGAHY
jgi:hypothetical protein